jgi:uncharacterized protein (TIGR03663 family)
VKLSTSESRAGQRECFYAVLLLLLAILVAGSLRFPELEVRPMHTDEATQAIKLRDLMQGQYLYDPLEHHGPTNLYAAEIRNYFRGSKAFADLTASDLRLVPVWFSLWLLLLLPLVRSGLGWMSIGWAAVFLAVSPIFVFYSRYFVMEMLLVLLSYTAMAGGWRFYLSRNPFWLWGCAISVGLMHATKETFVIHLAGMVGGAILAMTMRHLSGGLVLNRNKPEPISAKHWITFLVVAGLTSAAFFSQGFTQMGSVADSVKTYFSYAERAGGQGHEKPWYYYLQLLGWNQGGKFWKGESAGGFIWTELLILLFALLGMVRSFFGKGKGYHREFGLFLTGYAVLTLAAYSLISYKTPWCILATHFAVILLAGFGVAGFMNSLYASWGKWVFSCLVLVGAAHLGFQAYRVNFADDATTQPWLRTRNVHSSTANPYAYGFTPIGLRDTIVRRLEGYAERSPAGRALRVEVAVPPQSGGWPLPWYLRKFTSVAYLPDVEAVGSTRGVDPTADVILVEPALIKKLPEAVRGTDHDGGGTHVKDIFGMLNQQFWIQGYVKRGLENQGAAATPPPSAEPSSEQTPPTNDEPKPEPKAPAAEPSTPSTPPTAPEPTADSTPQTPAVPDAPEPPPMPNVNSTSPP